MEYEMIDISELLDEGEELKRIWKCEKEDDVKVITSRRRGVLDVEKMEIANSVEQLHEMDQRMLRYINDGVGLIKIWYNEEFEVYEHGVLVYRSKRKVHDAMWNKERGLLASMRIPTLRCVWYMSYKNKQEEVQYMGADVINELKYYNGHLYYITEAADAAPSVCNYHRNIRRKLPNADAAITYLPSVIPFASHLLLLAASAAHLHEIPQVFISNTPSHSLHRARIWISYRYRSLLQA